MKFMRPETNNDPPFASQYGKGEVRTDHSLKYLEKFQLSLDNILQSGREVHPDQFRQIFSEQIKEKLQLGDQYLDLKVDIYVSRVKVLQIVAGAQEGSDSLQKNSRQRESLAMPSDVFRSLVKEGHSLQNTLEEHFQQSEPLDEVLFWIDSLARKLDNKIREIHSIPSLETLDRMPRIVLGFLDLSQEFEERRALLSDENFNFSQRSQHRTAPSQQSKPLASRSFSSDFNQSAERQTFKTQQGDNFEKPAARDNQQRECLRPIENKLSMNQPKTNAKDQPGMNSNLLAEKNSKRSFAMVTIREIIQNDSNGVNFDNITAVNLAQQMVDDFPHLNQDREKLEEFCTFLKRLIKYPNVYRGLALKGFPSKLITKLLEKTSSELSNLEKKLSSNTPNQQTEQSSKTAKCDFPSEVTDGRIIKKKLKKDYSSKKVNMIHESFSNPHRRSQPKNPLRNSLGETLLRRVGIEESKLFKSTRSSDNLLRSGLVGSHRNRESNNEFSPFKGQSEFEASNQHAKQDDFRMAGEFGENFDDDEDDCFSNSGKVDFTRHFGGSFKESHGSPIVKNSEHRKKNRAPILYDPDEDDDDLGLSDLDLTVEEKKNSKTAKASTDSIFQIFNGVLKGLDEHLAPKIGLFTCSPLEIVKQIPQIMTERGHSLEVQGTTQAKIESYINKRINTNDHKERHIISGWAESHIPMCQDACEKMASSLLSKNKVGIFKYADCVQIFFMHKNQFRSEWRQKFHFTMKKLQKNSHSSLYFLIVFQPHKFECDLSLLKRIEPEIITPYKENKATQSQHDFQMNGSRKDSDRFMNDEHSLEASPVLEPYSRNKENPRKSMNTSQNDKGSSFLSKYMN